MKATGIVRKVDELGRIVLPVEWRRTLDIDAGTSVEILASGSQLILRRYLPGCILCGDLEVVDRTPRVCRRCRTSLLTAEGVLAAAD